MSGTFYAVDGSRMRFDATGVDTGTIYMSDGTKYLLDHTTSTITDKNNNVLYCNMSTRQWTDTLGRVISNPLPATPSVGNTVYTLPGLGGASINYTLHWQNLANALTPDSNNTTPALRYIADKYLPSPSLPPSDSNQGNYPQTQPATYQSLFQSVTPPDVDPGNPTPFPVPTLVIGPGQASGQLFNPIVLTQIDLPDGTSYKFSYNVYGELNKVIYPTGAYETYNYDVTLLNQDQFKQPYVQANRKISSRQLSADGNGDDLLTWQYLQSVPLGNTRATSIIAPDLTRTEIYKYDLPEPGDTTGKLYWPFGLSDSLNGIVFEKRMFSSSPGGTGGTMLRRELTQFDETVNSYPYTAAGISPPYTNTVSGYRNPRPVKEVSLTFEGSGSALAQTTTYSYDTTYQMTTGLDRTTANTYHYAIVSNTSTSDTAQAGTIAQIPTGSLAKVASTTYQNGSTYQSANILGLPTSIKIKDSSGSTIVSETDISHDDSGYAPAGRGLPTTVSTWDSTKGLVSNPSAFITTRATYDSYGNRTVTTDAKGNSTTTTFDATYHVYPVTITSAVPSDGTYGSNQPFTTSTVFDTTTGLPTSMTDANGQTTTMEYNDVFLRPTKVTEPNGHQTVSEYGAVNNSSTRYVKVRSQLDTTSWKDGYKWFDGLGRTIKTQSVETTGDVFVDTQYDNMGRAKQTSNPYRSGDAVIWTVPTYDNLGRVTSTLTPDGASVGTAYALATSGSQIGTAVTVTDQASKQRRSVTNALGQLTRVDEPTDAGGLGAISTPNQATTYSYDTLNNLLSVVQAGSGTPQCGPSGGTCSQTRTFSYSSLSRLTSATNPESGTINYVYDNNGNLTSKTDARSITTTYAYDNVNRVKTRSYSDGTTPSVSYYYDNLTNAKGKLIKVSSSISTTEYTSFDILGRVTGHKQTTDGTAYTTGYTYTLGGSADEETYPSTRVVKSVLNQNGDLSLVQSKKNSSAGYFSYAKNFTYSPAGATASMQLGNNLWESTQFNSRLQPTQIALGTTANATNKLNLNYDYGTTSDSGNVLSQTITVPGLAQPFIQNYTYDSLNRLVSATETNNGSQTWKQEFSYDRFGNRNFVTGSGHTTQPASFDATTNPAVSTANNRFTTGQGYSYDNGGNTTASANSQSYTYDAENKQTQVNNGASILGQYWYDGDGKRVKKYVPASGETTIFVYDGLGKQVAEYSTIVYTGTNAKVGYTTNDNLGSPRINTDANGAVIARHDYMPFGEELTAAKTSQRTTNLGYVGDTVRKQFIAYERDTESALDFVQARYFSNQLGRFQQSDPLYLELNRLVDPQQLNLYEYGRDNPLKFGDPTGLDIICDGEKCKDYLNGLQKDVSFKIKYDKGGKVILDGDVDKKKLSKSEKELLKAIEDGKNHVSIHAVDGSTDKNVFFGRSDFNYLGTRETRGSHTIAFGQANLLDDPINKGGMTSADLIGHETLEGYSESKGNNFEDSHDYANGFFGGLDGQDKGGTGGIVDGKVIQIAVNFKVHGTSTTERITMHYVTPIPREDFLKAKGAPYAQYPIKVEVEKKK